MSYHYIDATREDDAHALPDVETFYATAGEWPIDDIDDTNLRPMNAAGWYFAFLDGGLDSWSSEPCGPYTSEQEALEGARESNGYCPHGFAFHGGDASRCADCDNARANDAARERY